MSETTTLTSLGERVRARRALPPAELRRSIRRAAGATLAEVAAAVGTSPQNISHWELGLRFPREPALSRYAEALRVLQEACG